MLILVQLVGARSDRPANYLEEDMPLPQLGTEAYAQQLAREAEVIKADLNGMKELARIRAASSGRPYVIELNAVNNSQAGLCTLQDVAAYNARVQAHRAAENKAKQARANQREAAKIQAAVCGSCFTVHAGECY